MKTNMTLHAIITCSQSDKCIKEGRGVIKPRTHLFGKVEIFLYNQEKNTFGKTSAA